MADRRDILVNLLGQETVSAAAARAGRGLGRLGDDFDSTAADARGLDRQINDVEQSLRDLSVAYARAGDAGERMDITRALRQQESELRRLQRARGQLGDPDEDGSAGRRIGRRLGGNIAEGLSSAGGPISNALSKVFGTLPPQAQAAIGGGLIAAVGSVAPLIGGVLAGAVVGGVGIGGVLGGIAVAARHPEVKSAAAETGKQFASTMERSAATFVPATIDALGLVKSEIRSMEGDFEQIFSGASRWVRPLAESATGLVRNLLPGIQAVVDQGGPVIDELASWGPKLGTLLSEVFSDFAGQAENGARALATFWTVMEAGIRFTSNVIAGLAAVYGGMELLSALLRQDVGKILELTSAEKGATGAGAEMAGGMQVIIDGFTKAKTKTVDAVTALREWGSTLDEMTGKNISARQAQRDLEQAIDDATAAVTENGKTAINHGAALDINSAKGRANAAALDRIAQESNDAYDAILAQTGSQELANAASDRGRAKFLELAGKMGLSKEAAIRLADSLLRIKDRKVTVTANTGPALAAAAALQARINNMSARINVYAEPSGGFGGGAHTGFGNSTGIADGGPIYGSGPKGVDSVPAVLAPGEHVLTAKEVDAAGGHRKVEAWRKSLLSRVPTAAMGAAGGGSGGGGAQRVEVVLRIDGSDRGIIGALLKGIKDAGGNPAVLGIGGRW